MSVDGLYDWNVGFFNVKGSNIFFLHRGEDFFKGKVLKPEVQIA